MALDVGTLYATLTIRDEDFQSALSRARSNMEGAGRSSASMASAVQRASAAAQAAHAAHATATTRLSSAQRDLNTLMNNSARTADQVAQAEQRVAQARAQVAQTTVRAHDSLANLNRENDAAATSTNNLTTALGKAKSAAALMGVTVGASGSVKFLTDAITNARALGAQTNQMNVLFGDSKTTISDWGSTASSTLRMSQREAQGAAIQFATFGKAIGRSGPELASWSQDLTKLAGNLGSFYGMDTATAVEAMSSAFAGSAETMRPYGVLLDDATLRNIAFKEGITESNRQLTSQEKILATYVGMKQQLAHVDGDIERSNGKYGASLKELKARYEDTSAAIGGKIIPIANTFVQTLSGPGMQTFGVLAEKVGGLAEGLRLLGSVFGLLPGPIQAAVAALVAGKIASLALAPAVNRAGTAITGMATTARLQGMMAMDRLRGAFLNAGLGAAGFTRTAATTGGAMSAIGRGAKSALAAMGGPWMLAVTAGILLLARHAKKSQEAKQRQDEFASATQGLAQIMSNTNGTYSQAGQKAASTMLETVKLADGSKTLGQAFDDMGISGSRAARGLAGIGTDAARTRSDLEGLHAEQRKNLGFWDKMGQQVSNTFRGEEWDYETDASKLLDSYDLAQQKIKENQEKLKREAQNGGDVVIASDGTAYIGAMTEAMIDFDKASSSASKQVDILAKALSGLRNDSLTIHDAEAAVNDSMRGMSDLKGTLGDVGLDRFGMIDTTTEKGAKADSAARKAAEDYDQLAAAIFTATGSAEAVEKAMQGTYDRFVENATAMLGSKEQALQLAEALGLIPKDAAVELGIKNEAATRSLIDTIAGKVTDFNNTSATVTVDVLDEKAIESLEAAGFAVEELPDEKGFTLTATTANAVAALNGAKGAVDGIPASKVITVDTPGASETIDKLNEANILTHVDNEKRIVVEDNSADTIIALAKLGVTTTSLPDGTIVITDNSAAVAGNIDRNLNGKRTTGTHTIYTSTFLTQAQVTDSQTFSTDGSGGKVPLADGGILAGKYANGGINRMPASAEIMSPRPNYIMVAEPETMGEAFIPLAPSKRARSEQLLGTVANKFGMSLMRGDVEAFAEGGFGGSHGSMPETAAVTLSARKGVDARGTGLVGAAGVGHMVASLLGGKGFDTGGTSIPGMSDWGLEEKLRKQLEAWAGIQSTEHQLSEDELRQLDRDIEDGNANLRGARIDVQKANDALHEAETAEKPDEYTIRSARISVQEAEAKLRETERENAKLADRKAKAGDTAKTADLPEFKDWLSEQINGPKPMSEEDREALRESVESGVSAEERAMFAVEKAQIALDKANRAPKDDKDKGATQAEKDDALADFENAKRSLARVQEDNARLASKYAGNVAATSGGSGVSSSAPAGGGLSGEQQSIVNSLGSVAQGNPGATYQIIVGQVNNGPVSVNDPQKLLETPNSTGDPIHEAMMRLGVK
ncbi:MULTISPECIES: hypothetical protein [Rhodococcus]|uniref:hypothetical protein n=1 Tax=Rhodococcus TaxID=1827 RepID=UPI0007AE8CCC|nr:MULTISPECIES: hypothetical protein [Rhodococcus]KZL33230.1 hypothetical protein A3852_13120 [Rhodococcus qingshengii]MCE4161610.1 hypothetical protein [Rhodococcus sp. Ni2]